MKRGKLVSSAALNHLYAKYHYDAKRRNMYWGISREEFARLTTQNCHYCGCGPSNRNRGHRYNGLDRKNNRRGYEPWNVLPCCVRCNSIKGEHLSYVEMKAAIAVILRVRKK